MDLMGADFLDPRVGAVRTVTGGRVVSTEAPLVQTFRFDARRSGSPTRGSRQISGKSRNYRAARTVFNNFRGWHGRSSRTLAVYIQSEFLRQCGISTYIFINVVLYSDIIDSISN